MKTKEKNEMRKSRGNSRRGGSMVEFAVTMPVLLIMAVGAADFSRMFVEATVLSGAAASGAKYGAQDNRRSAEFSEMEGLAGNSADGVPDGTPTAERVCDCPDSPGVWVDCLTTMCPASYDSPRAYVKVRIGKTFSTMGYYPKVPNSVPLNMTGYMRVQ